LSTGSGIPNMVKIGVGRDLSLDENYDDGIKVDVSKLKQFYSEISKSVGVSVSMLFEFEDTEGD